MYLADVIGQLRLKEELTAITTNLKRWAVLLRGPYGWGKTTIALALAGVLGFYSYQLPMAGKFEMRLGEVHIVDECHLIKHTENLYPLLEENNFIFCTNMASNLPLAFLSRCMEFRMEPYTVEQLGRIVEVHSTVPLEWDVCYGIATRCKGNPRIGVMYMITFTSLCKSRGANPGMAEMEEFFHLRGVEPDGFTKEDRRYVTALEVGSKSLATLAATLNRDKGEILRLEQWLLQRGIIEITSRGRKLCS